MYKLQNDEIDKIERDTSRKAEDLSEDELIAAMHKLGIQRRELSDDDKRKLESA